MSQQDRYVHSLATHPAQVFGREVDFVRPNHLPQLFDSSGADELAESLLDDSRLRAHAGYFERLPHQPVVDLQCQAPPTPMRTLLRLSHNRCSCEEILDSLQLRTGWGGWTSTSMAALELRNAAPSPSDDLSQLLLGKPPLEPLSSQPLSVSQRP